MEEISEQLKEEMLAWVLGEMRAAEALGVTVCVDGVPYLSQQEDTIRQVMENHYYMKNYTGDENGKIVQIDFEALV